MNLSPRAVLCLVVMFLLGSPTSTAAARIAKKPVILAQESASTIVSAAEPDSSGVDFPTSPIPRMTTDDAAAHNSDITSMSTDKDGRFLVTGSGDKTARIWAYSDRLALRSVAVLRVPLIEADLAGRGNADVGAINAVAQSANAKYVAVGGIFTPDRNEPIYLFDRLTGRMLPKRFVGSTRAVKALTFSPNGPYLAGGTTIRGAHGVGCVRGGAAVHVWNYEEQGPSPTVRPLFSDTAFNGDVNDVVFAPDGTLVAASDDGSIRQYRPKENGQFALRSSLSPPIDRYSHVPSRVAISSAGDIAIIFVPRSDDCTLGGVGRRHGSTANTGNVSYVVAYDKRGTLLFTFDLQDDRGGTLSAVDWSSDSQMIFVGGSYGYDPDTPYYPVLRLDRAGRPSPTRTSDPASWAIRSLLITDRITAIKSLPGDRLAVATAEPKLGIISQTSGDVVSTTTQHIPHFQDRTKIDVRPSPGCGDVADFRVGEDGTVVEIPDSRRKRHYHFDAANRELAFERNGNDRKMSSPSQSSAVTRVLISGNDICGMFGDEGQPATIDIQTLADPSGRVVATKRVAMPPGEFVRSKAVLESLGLIAIGTEWSVRLYSRDGTAAPGWETPHYSASPVWRVSFSADGRFVLAAFGDGTVRWYDRKSGAELLCLYVGEIGTNQEWVVWTSTGYYDASAEGAKLVGWHVNPKAAPNNSARPSLFYPFDVFPTFKRRGLAAEVLQGRIPAAPPAETIKSELPPTVRLVGIESELKDGQLALEVTVEITKPSDRRVANLYLVPSRGTLTAILEPGEGLRTYSMEVHPDSESLTLEVTTFGDDGNEVYGPRMTALLPRNEADTKVTKKLGRLFALVLGVSNYDDDRLKLGGAAGDARDFADALAKQVLLYSGKPSITVIPERATAAQIRKAFDDFAQLLKSSATSSDVAMIFLSGHGATVAGSNSDEPSAFYFLPKAFKLPDAVEADELGRVEGSKVDKLAWNDAVSGEVLVNAVKQIDVRTIVFLDTCRAGSVDAKSFIVDNGDLVKTFRSPGKEPIIFSASGDKNPSWECGNESKKRGCFTTAILQRLQDPHKTPRVTYTDLSRHLHFVVPMSTTKKRPQQTPWVTTLAGDDPFILNSVAPDARVAAN